MDGALAIGKASLQHELVKIIKKKNEEPTPQQCLYDATKKIK